MMKKYFSNIFALAALLMAGAAFTACSSEDNSIEQPANPVGEKTYTLTINASKGANASTRALALNGTKLVASWAEGDELSVFKAENRTGCTAGNLLGTISPVAGSISADGAKATFTGTLTGTVSNGDKLMLVYHPAAFAITGFEGQAGTLASASNLDCATAQVTASVSGSDITISETSATFTTHTAMLKLTLTTDGTTTINPTSLKMSMSALGVTLKEFTFTPTDATYTANGNGVLYFALPSVDDVIAGLALESKIVTKEQLAAATITYTATVGSDVYTATKTGYTFAAGKYYAGTLTMTEAPSVTEVTTFSELKTALSAGKNVKLMNDIECTSETEININGAFIEITSNGPLTIDGNGKKLSTTSAIRAFKVGYSATVAFKNLTLTGFVSGGGPAINNFGTIVLDGCTISNCHVSNSQGGGAIENKSSGKLYAINTTFSGNYSGEIGGAINNYNGSLYMSDCTFTDNYTTKSNAYWGGAIGINGGSEVRLINCAFSGNWYGTTTGPSDIGVFNKPTNYTIAGCTGATIASNGDDITTNASGTATLNYSDLSNISFTYNAE